MASTTRRQPYSTRDLDSSGADSVGDSLNSLVRALGRQAAREWSTTPDDGVGPSSVAQTSDERDSSQRTNSKHGG